MKWLKRREMFVNGIGQLFFECATESDSKIIFILYSRVPTISHVYIQKCDREYNVAAVPSLLCVLSKCHALVPSKRSAIDHVFMFHPQCFVITSWLFVSWSSSLSLSLYFLLRHFSSSRLSATLLSPAN